MNDNKRKAEVPSSSEKDPERFYCPYPGCNRSFAELWRLKVHYRAPPDIRGSGKERGHGTELTHCPKCGKTLKPGKHHVGCSAGRSAPRQASKRSRVSGDDADGRSDLSPADSAEPPIPVAPLTLPSGLPFSLDNPSSAMASFNMLPNQYSNSLNFLGFDSGASKHPGFPQGLHPEHPFPGYLGQLDGLQSLHAHAHAAQAVHAAQAAHVQAAQAAQALQAAQSASNAAAAAAAAAAAVPNPLMYHHHQQHQQQQQQQQQLLLAGNPYMPLIHAGHGFHAAPPPLLHGGHHMQHHLPVHPSQVPLSQPPSTAQPLAHHPPFVGFEGIFDYTDSGLPDRPPSPPPLPADFPGLGGMLFNFKQFASKPSSGLELHHSDDGGSLHSSHHPLVKQEDGGKSQLATESSTDGDLIHILFGLSDDTPASATINLRNHTDDSSKPSSCPHHDSFMPDRSGQGNHETAVRPAENGKLAKEQTEPSNSKASMSQKLDTGPQSPGDACNGTFLDDHALLPKVDSAAELLRLPDGLTGFSDKSDAGCMSRLLGLDHELFGLLQ